jgi:hypothetical protein
MAGNNGSSISQLKKCGLPIKGPLYNNAHAYIRDNY